MIILEKPYVSEFLKSEIRRHGWPVLDNAVARAVLGPMAGLVPDGAFVAGLTSDHPRLYCNSENAIGWIDRHMAHTELPAMIGLCKDKVRFRDCIRSMYPDFRYTGVALDDLDDIDPHTLAMPCIIKPAIGFFSMGVHRVG